MISVILLIVHLPGLLQQHKSSLQTFGQSFEALVIPLDQKMEDAFSMFPFYKWKEMKSFKNSVLPYVYKYPCMTHPRTKRTKRTSQMHSSFILKLLELPPRQYI